MSLGVCLTPAPLPDGQMVACRHCRVCRDNRLNDLIGRCIAESRSGLTSRTFAVTLTYGGGEDNINAAIFIYPDIQKFMKRLRFAGYKVRYIVAGETGGKKGRVHWHIILFFQGKAPDVPLDSRIMWQFWPHGFSYFQNPDYRGFKYVMKYALKSEDYEPERGKCLYMSKLPPLGYHWFISRAEELVQKGLPLPSPEYAFADIQSRHTDGRYKPRRFWLQGRMRQLFVRHYVEYWAVYHNTPCPDTDFVRKEYSDPIDRAETMRDPLAFERELVRKREESFRAAGNRMARPSVPLTIDPEAPREILGYLMLHPEYEGGMCVLWTTGELDIDLGEDNTWYLDCNGREINAIKGVNLTLADQLTLVPLSDNLKRNIVNWIIQLLPPL